MNIETKYNISQRVFYMVDNQICSCQIWQIRTQIDKRYPDSIEYLLIGSEGHAQWFNQQNCYKDINALVAELIEKKYDYESNAH